MQQITKEFSCPVIFEHPLIHFRQQYDWDCGLSCVLMLLPRTERKKFLNNFDIICKEEDFGKSTWTIDLCYVLKRCNIKHKYFTSTLGINSGYEGYSYYDKILAKDAHRIIKRFKTAPQDGILIKQKLITNDDIIEHLATEGPIILLTNASLLTCDICKSKKLSTELRSCFPWKITFKGHYIVLSGYNLNVRKFIYRNPTMKDRVCMISFNQLTEARTAYGTDDDTIFIYPDKN